MKKLVTLSILLALICSVNLYAQTAATITWTCVEPDSTRATVAGNVIGQPSFGLNMVVRDYAGASSTGPLSSTHQRWYPYANGAAISWGNENDIVLGRYIQFSCGPKSGNSLTVKTLSASLAAGGSSTGVRANAYYSVDDTNFTSMTKLNSDIMILHQGSYNPTDTLISYTLNATIANGKMFNFRIYPWYNTTPSTSKYLYIQNVVITGTTSSATKVDIDKIIPISPELEQNYPNPFNPTTMITFGLSKASNVKLTVYNLIGQEVKILVNGEMAAGYHSVDFKANNLPSGVYIYRLTSENESISKKMILNR
jgi:hypothetical protein